MQVQISDQRDANFPVKIARMNVTTLCDTGANMSCISYACYVKPKDQPYLKTVLVMSVHTTTGHDLCSAGLYVLWNCNR